MKEVTNGKTFKAEEALASLVQLQAAVCTEGMVERFTPLRAKPPGDGDNRPWVFQLTLNPMKQGADETRAALLAVGGNSLGMLVGLGIKPDAGRRMWLAEAISMDLA